MDIFTQINESGNTVILVTHEEDIAAKAKRIIRLRDGLVEMSEDRLQIPAVSNTKEQFTINENSSKQLVDDNQNELENTIQIESKETDHTSENEPLF